MSIFKNNDDYEEYEEEEEHEQEENTIIPILDFISTWFIRIGIVFATIALIYFIATGRFATALLYIIGLIVAYFFGYFFMFVLDKLFSNN